MLQVILSALSGLAGAVVTYLAIRRRYLLSERTVYIEAVARMTGNLQREIERVNAERLLLLDRIAELEAESRTLRRQLGQHSEKG